MDGTLPHAGPLAIRRARVDDLQAVELLINRATDEMRRLGIEQWDELYPTRNLLRADLAAGTMHVSFRDDRIAGVIVLNETQEPEYASVSWSVSGRPLVVHRLAVDPDFQRLGIATMLMRHAESLASAGYDAIRLDAFAKNPAAVSLYERLGYRRAGTVRFRKGEFICFEKPTRT